MGFQDANMTILISRQALEEIHKNGEQSYPDEGAGLILGIVEDGIKKVVKLMKFPNAREESARHNRYLLTPMDYLRGETEAARSGLDVLGVFHSHPNHPNLPSDFDRQWAMPMLSYLITSVNNGKAAGSRAWILKEDRSGFTEETISIIDGIKT
jgi:proteasome lid subunit RPN8/RPN11